MLRRKRFRSIVVADDVFSVVALPERNATAAQQAVAGNRGKGFERAHNVTQLGTPWGALLLGIQRSGTGPGKPCPYSPITRLVRIADHHDPVDVIGNDDERIKL
jgi:hypothetical protein